MEEEKENSALKRPREAVSEDNVPSTSEGNDEKKRRRLQAAGWSPKASSSGLQAEFYSKPDTPMVPSVRSRIQQLSRRREGASPLAQRCLSDPGGYNPSVSPYGQVFRGASIGQAEFHQRQERFKGPDFQASPTQTTGQASTPQMTRSNFVSAIQQKLQSTPAASSKQASRIHQEREEELNQLPFQPISENAWLKRSISDPASSRQRDRDAGMKDCSFSAAIAACEETLSSSGTGETAATGCDAHVELDTSNKEQLLLGWEEEGNGEDEQPGTQQPPTVLKLCFNEDPSFSKAPFSEAQSASQSCTFEETLEISKAAEDGGCEGGDGSAYSEEGIELSTDGELRLWRYPRGEEESIQAGEQQEDAEEEEEEGESSRGDKVEAGFLCGEGYSGDAPLEMQEDPEESQSSLDEGHHDGAGTEGVICILKSNQKDAGGGIERDDGCKQSREIQSAAGGDDAAAESDGLGGEKEAKDSQTGCTELKHGGDVQAESSDAEGKGGAPSLTRGPVSDHLWESERMEQDAGGGTQGAEGGGHAKKVVFILKPELNNDSTASEAGADASMSGHTDAGLISSDETNTSQIIDQMFEEVLECAEREEERRGGEHSGDPDSGIGVSPGNKEETDEALQRGHGEGEEVEGEQREEVEGEQREEVEGEQREEVEGEQREEVEGEQREEVEGEQQEEVEGEQQEEVEGEQQEEVEGEQQEEVEGEQQEEVEGEQREEVEGQCDGSQRPECSSDELTFPASGILSPLSRAVEAVVTPLRRAASRESNPSSVLTPEGSRHASPVESAPLYSIEAYRTQRRTKLPTVQSAASGVQRRAAEKPQTSVDTKEKITALKEEAGRLQTMIKQTLQALSCCTDEEHGRGSLEEAEAEKLLLVSSERHSALQAEVARLRKFGGDCEDVSQQPCRGTLSITNIQLPLKVEFVCSSHKRTGRPSHYFFVLIRYGPCNIIATPLATAADAQNGDTISFQTSVTLKDIRSTFVIDVEVYSLSHISGSKFSADQSSTKSRVTPRKLLNTITRSSNSVTSAALPALNTPRSSNFVLVGSHQISLASLGRSKFPLDKMKLDGKIRRLLGDEFQEKVPFLSPLEGNIYLRLDSESHSDVQHQGFLTMFELIGGFGVWHRQYFVLEGCKLFHWNNPNDQETKEAEGSVSLSGSHSRCVRTVTRDSCARPFTFELVSDVPEQQDAGAKLWFSADSKQESLDWMEKLNQSLLDFNTWKRSSAAPVDSCSSGKLRESIL